MPAHAPARLPRRLLVGLTSAALVGGAVGLVPLLGSASADACPTWTDPSGDSGVITPVGTEPTGATGDTDLDIVSTTVMVAPDGGLVVAVKVAGLKDAGPDASPGDEFVVNSTVDGKATKVTLARDTFFSGTERATLAAAASATGKAVFDVKSSTVTGTFTADQVKTAFGKPVAGLKMTGFETLAYGWTLTPAGPSLGFPNMDDAPAPASLSYTDAGAGCGGVASTPAAGSGSPTATPTTAPPSSAGSDGLFPQPRKGCVQYKDATGDADPTGSGLDNLDNLDVTQVNLKSPSGQLQVFVGLVDPAASMDPWWDGPIWSTTFTVNGKAVTLSGSKAGPAAATVAGTASKDLNAALAVDAKAKNVVFTVPLDKLSTAVGAPVVAGTPITGTSVLTQADSALGAQDADTAAGTKDSEKTYTYGDNSCFMPPPGVLALDADRTGQYGDVTELFATLTDADGSPVQGAKLVGMISGGRAVAATTDDDGIADLKLPLLVPAGSKTLSVRFAGDSDVGAVTATVPFTVVPEKTVLRVASIRGGVRAIVLDDDRHPVVGRYVTFTVGSAKRQVKTNSHGIADLTRLKKGTVVKAVFLPVKGYYLGSKTLTARAG